MPRRAVALAVYARGSGALDQAEDLVRATLARCEERGWPTADARRELGWILLERGKFTDAGYHLAHARWWYRECDLRRPEGSSVERSPNDRLGCPGRLGHPTRLSP